MLSGMPALLLAILSTNMHKNPTNEPNVGTMHAHAHLHCVCWYREGYVLVHGVVPSLYTICATWYDARSAYFWVSAHTIWMIKKHNRSNPWANTCSASSSHLVLCQVYSMCNQKWWSDFWQCLVILQNSTDLLRQHLLHFHCVWHCNNSGTPVLTLHTDTAVDAVNQDWHTYFAPECCQW